MRWVVPLVLLVLVCACEGGSSDDSGNLSEADRDATIGAMSALELMAFTFEGGPSEDEIREPLLEAFECFDTRDTETNRERAGSALVELSNEYEIPEMDILDEMLNICDAGVNMSFADAAGIAAAGIVIDR